MDGKDREDKSIEHVVPGRLPGFYLVNVVPIGTETWKAGVYLFAISVTQGVKHGQTLTRVQMD